MINVFAIAKDASITLAGKDRCGGYFPDLWAVFLFVCSLSLGATNKQTNTERLYAAINRVMPYPGGGSSLWGLLCGKIFVRSFAIPSVSERTNKKESSLVEILLEAKVAYDDLALIVQICHHIFLAKGSAAVA